MNYLNEDQELMVDSVREFAQQEVEPIVLERMEENDEFPLDLIDRMWDLGIPTMTLPEEYGGIGETKVCQLAVVEELSKVDAGLALAGTSSVVVSLLLRVGTDEQKKKYLPILLDRNPCAFAFTEPTAGSDSGGIQTTAVHEGNEWIINGQKTFITCAGSAKYFLISAKTKATEKGGISAFLFPADAPGVKVGSIFNKLGMHGTDTGELFFEDVHVPEDALIGIPDHGLRATLSLLDEARLSVAAAAIGTAEAALAKGIEFIKERDAFGTKLSNMQGLQWYVAECSSKIAAARALLYEVAQEFDNHENVTADAARAKLVATDMCCEVTNKAVQLCGGLGTVHDYGVERFYRDAKMFQIIEGTSEILKIVISRADLH
ncbi:MAG: acyl-CoA dehydrogenase family protein [Eggerthellaceae bacterium]|jgi:alkylation response protein AidB-like acyl-CoA dehydrogenase